MYISFPVFNVALSFYQIFFRVVIIRETCKNRDNRIFGYLYPDITIVTGNDLNIVIV